MSLVLTRKLGQGVQIDTPSGSIKIVLTRLESNQTGLGIDTPEKWPVHRLTRGGEIEKDYSPEEVPTKKMYQSYDIKELHGKKLDMFVGVDDGGTDKAVLMGKDMSTGNIYFIQEKN